MKFVTDLAKGILGEPDPVELWEEIVSHIPDEVFLKDDLKILCPACGHATEADVLVQRMISLGINKEKIKDSIYLMDKYKAFTNAALRKGYQKVLKQDFIEWETDMKFDVVIGNPPYTSGTQGAAPIWQKFITKSFEMSNCVAMVVPYSLSRSPNYSDLRETINQHGVRSYKILPKDTFKNADVHTLYFLADSNAEKHNGVWFEDSTFENIIKKIENMCGKQYYDKPTSERQIVFKGVKSTFAEGKIIDSLNSKGFQIKEGYLDADVDSHRIVTSYLPNHRHHLLALEYVKPGLGVPKKYRQLITKNKYEADSMVSYLKTTLPTVIYSLTKTSRTLDGPQTRFIPEVPFTKIWDDNSVYKYFSLTSAEIKYLEERY